MNDTELIEAVPRQWSGMPDEAFRSESGESEALSAEHPTIWVSHLEGRVECGEQTFCRPLNWIDYPKIARGDDNRIVPVGVNLCEVETSEARLEVRHPSTPFRLELYDGPFPAEASPF